MRALWRGGDEHRRPLKVAAEIDTHHAANPAERAVLVILGASNHVVQLTALWQPQS